jgi:hypothetical protein
MHIFNIQSLSQRPDTLAPFHFQWMDTALRNNLTYHSLISIVLLNPSDGFLQKMNLAGKT